MLSTAEFQQKLQAGQIQAALALLVRETIELDVTTRLTEDAQTNSEYLRTKINLLTGIVENEVGSALDIDSSCYLKLQELHFDRIEIGHRIVQDYLQQIKEILTVLSPASISTSLQLTNDAAATQLDSFELPNTTPKLQPSMSNTIELNNLAPIYTSAVDDEIDLSIDETTEVWEEWVEDEDFISEAAILQPPTVAAKLTGPSWEEGWASRQLNPIEVKPISSRSTTDSIDPGSQWDNFEPEYIGISADPQPQIGNNSDFHLMDRLLADMDI
jgi:hypothetical protein